MAGLRPVTHLDVTIHAIAHAEPLCSTTISASTSTSTSASDSTSASQLYSDHPHSSNAIMVPCASIHHHNNNNNNNDFFINEFNNINNNNNNNETPLSFLDPPSISWVATLDLIPHEDTDPTHLARLVAHLRRLDDESLLPTIIATASKPHVILDGHHRWKSSIALGITHVPVWLIDDDRADADARTLLPVPRDIFRNATALAHAVSRREKENMGSRESYSFFRLRVYDTRRARSDRVLRISQIADAARAAHASASAASAKKNNTNNINNDDNDNNDDDDDAGTSKIKFGIKGTMHVAVPYAAGWPTRSVARLRRYGGFNWNPDTVDDDNVFENDEEMEEMEEEQEQIDDDDDDDENETIGEIITRLRTQIKNSNSSRRKSKTKTSDNMTKTEVADASASAQQLLLPELRLEKVAPRIEWGLWKTGGRGGSSARLVTRTGVDAAKYRLWKIAQ